MAKYRADDLIKRPDQLHLNQKRWVLVRPLNYRCDTIWQRLKYTWGVLWGRYDALEWDSQ